MANNVQACKKEVTQVRGSSEGIKKSGKGHDYLGRVSWSWRESYGFTSGHKIKNKRA